MGVKNSLVTLDQLLGAEQGTGSGFGIVGRQIFDQIMNVLADKHPFLAMHYRKSPVFRTTLADKSEIYGNIVLPNDFTVKSYNADTKKMILAGSDGASFIRPQFFIRGVDAAKGLIEQFTTVYIKEVTTTGDDTELTLQTTMPWVVANGDTVQIVSQAQASDSVAPDGTSKMPSVDTVTIGFLRDVFGFNWFSNPDTVYDHIKQNKVAISERMLWHYENMLKFGNGQTTLTVSGKKVLVPTGFLYKMFHGTVKPLCVDDEISLKAGSVVRYNFNNTVTFPDLSRLSELWRKGDGDQYFFHDSALGKAISDLIPENVVPTTYEEFKDAKIGMKSIQFQNGHKIHFVLDPNLDRIRSNIWYGVNYKYLPRIEYNFNGKIGDGDLGQYLKTGKWSKGAAPDGNMYWSPVSTAENRSATRSELMMVGSVGIYGAECFAFGTHKCNTSVPDYR